MSSLTRGLATAVSPISASSLVRKTLLQSAPPSHPPGPLTTHSLHSTLHSLHPSSLPARPPPSSFLAGARRTLQARQLGVAPSSLPLTRDNFPGKDESANGSWSMQYLKKRVLRHMEERGEVLKITRGRWDRLAPGGEVEAESRAVELEESVGKGKKTAKRETEEHVWVTREMWDERSRNGKEDREKLGEVKRGLDRVQGDRELKEKYGMA
ncbi:hypothetical protein P7C70_g5075, partial [Phenoliferia sp. Uapishka_3]